MEVESELGVGTCFEFDYRKAWPASQALAYLEEQRDKHFDLKLVDLFMTLLPQVEVIHERWSELN